MGVAVTLARCRGIADKVGSHQAEVPATRLRVPATRLRVPPTRARLTATVLRVAVTMLRVAVTMLRCRCHGVSTKKAGRSLARLVVTQTCGGSAQDRLRVLFGLL